LAYLHGTPVLPKVILLDVMMPVMDGIAFLHAKQADPSIKDFPPCSTHLQHHLKVLQLPIEVVLPKPLDDDLLVAIATDPVTPPTKDRSRTPGCGRARSTAIPAGCEKRAQLRKRRNVTRDVAAQNQC
jgi:response regulator RpfG family c-di-GMP phosphodiesterase